MPSGELTVMTKRHKVRSALQCIDRKGCYCFFSIVKNLVTLKVKRVKKLIAKGNVGSTVVFRLMYASFSRPAIISTSSPSVCYSKKRGRESLAQTHLDRSSFSFSHNKLMLRVYSHFVVIVVGYVASLFFPKPKLNKNLLYSGWRKQRGAKTLALKAV
jgi:hypothetical protein